MDKLNFNVHQCSNDHNKPILYAVVTEKKKVKTI